MSSLSLKRFKAPLLNAFDLSVSSGECVSLSGPSGSGKTRLLRAIADLDPHMGEALVDDTAAAELTGPDWRNRVGLLPAESFWWGEKVIDHFQTQQDENLNSLGFSPDCSDWEVARLSSGEKQRLALARLLQNRPGVLLLDEPTANLDQENTQRVERLIGAWRKEHGCAVIWTSHDQEQQKRVASRHFSIEAGQLRESSCS